MATGYVSIFHQNMGKKKKKGVDGAYPLHKGVILPRPEQPTGSFHAVQENHSHEERLEPAALLSLKQSALQIVHHGLAELRSPLLCCRPQLTA